MDSIYPFQLIPLASYAPVAADIVIFSLPQDSSGGVPTGITDIRRCWHQKYASFLTLFRRVPGTLRGFFRKLLLPMALMRDQSGHQGGQDMTSLQSVPSRDLACMPK
ncbi:hypothetical protein ANTRET_LOCUS154 [Anthophora retusa]